MAGQTGYILLGGRSTPSPQNLVSDYREANIFITSKEIVVSFITEEIEASGDDDP